MKAARVTDQLIQTYLTADEAARHLRVSRGWLYLQIMGRKIPCIRLGRGRAVRFRLSDLDRWMAQHVKGPRAKRRTRKERRA